MPKKKAGIRTVVVFDGGLQAKDMFADLVIERYFKEKNDILFKKDTSLYTVGSVPMVHGRLDCAEKNP